MKAILLPPAQHIDSRGGSKVERKPAGIRNLLCLAEDHQARFFLTSTSEVYGDPKFIRSRKRHRGW